jgi:hypothetical protein
MSKHILHLDGIAFWTPTLIDWAQASAAFRGEASLLDPPARRPAPELLAPTERRRAPDTVAIALEVAARAVAQAGRTPEELPSVFASAHGDLAINDYMCSTLVNEPMAISPTKFHNSVHNASAGYWTIGTGCMQASTALTAFEHSFAHGLLEAISQASVEQQPVLLVAYDIAACGALASVTTSRGMLAVAMVLNPMPSKHSLGAMTWSLRSGAQHAAALTSLAARSLQANAMADCLPLLEVLSLNTGNVLLPLGDTLALHIDWTPRDE